jgi:hypothetical protein
MRLHVVVNARGEVIGTVPITPPTRGKNEGIVGVAPLPDQRVYELDLPEAEVPTDPVALHTTCDQAIKSGAAQKLG